MKPTFGITRQVLLLSAFLVLIPVVGYLAVNHYSTLLLSGQRQAVLDTARQVAGTLSEANPNELARVLGPGEAHDPAKNLYAYPLTRPISIDGKDDDWQPLLGRAREYGKQNIIEVWQHYTEASMHFSLLVGRRDDSLYVFMRVADNRVVYRQIGSLSVHRNDHVQLAIVDPSGAYHRYTIAPMQPGPTHPFLVTPVDNGGRAIRKEPGIDAFWLATENGYNVEARIPLALASGQIAVTVTDVDDSHGREPIATIGTASTSNPQAIGTVLLPSAKLERMLAALNLQYSRVRIVDDDARLVAQSGDIAVADGLWHDAAGGPGIAEQRAAPLFAAPNPNVVDEPADEAHITGAAIAAGLAGHGDVASRPSSDGTANILSAAWPVKVDGRTAGAVVVEQTTNAVTRLQQRLTMGLVGAMILIALVGIAMLVCYAYFLSRRVNRITHGLSAATDAQGRVRERMPASAARDELGELERTFSDIIARLRQYNQYLEDMARQLSHELRTPVSVIRSSLDNLAMQPLDDEASVYIKRAHEGVQRLATILTNMTEATRLEETMAATDMEYFDLAEVVSGCVKGYELAYPGQSFEVSIEDEFDKLNGLPDLIAQMLDKLVSNAVEFTTPGTPVKIRLTLEDKAILRVINSGPRLPAEMQDRLFDSMISVRRSGDQNTSHLGLGLYIAKIIAEFHGGTISANNREDTEGVIVTVRLPMMRITAAN